MNIFNGKTGMKPDIRPSKLLLAAALFVIGMPAMCGHAFAQDGQSNIQERIDSLGLSSPAQMMRPDEGVLTGREDLVLLIKRKLFEAYLTPSVQYTNNAFLADKNRKDDRLASLTGGLRVSTVIDNSLNVFADVSMTGARYDKYDQLDYNVIQGVVGAGYNRGSWVTSLSYAPAYVYDDNRKDHIVSLHRLSGYLSRSFILGPRVALSPYLSLQVTPSDPHEYGFYQGDIGVQGIVALHEDVRLSFGPRIYAKKYFDYFEKVTGKERKDTGAGLNLNLQWTPLENVSLSMGATFTTNDSNLRGSDYNAFTASPSLGLSVKF